MKNYDAIVIGTGQAGPNLASRLSAAGEKVAVVERHRFGGTCVNNGCIPTKTLVASAYAAYMARQAGGFGIQITGEITTDMKAVKARKDALVADSNEGVEKRMTGLDNCTVYRGHARFESPTTVRVGDELLEAKKIFINVGARAFVPPIPGIETVEVLTNSTMMDIDTLPGHLIIIGGGYIGLEFAQMYRRFGSRVTVLARGDRVLSRDDEDVSAGISEILTGEGVEILTTACDFTVSQSGERIQVTVDCKRKVRTIDGSHLLVATGRVPNTHDLGLDKAGVKTNKRGFIDVDDQLRTSQTGIWAMGDCNGQGTFTHTSYNDSEIVAANLLDLSPRRVSDRIPAFALYTDPPLGRVGMSEAEVRASGRPALIAKMPMSRVARAKERSETRGFMKVLVDAETKQILGAALLGIGCDEIIHVILDVMYAQAPYTVIERAMHIHPTVSELLPTLFAELKPLT